METIVSTQEAADILGVRPTTILKMVRRGLLEGDKPRPQRHFKLEDVVALRERPKPGPRKKN
jgi:excisionase family DNA binding protein